MGRLRNQQWLAQTRMGPDKVVVRLEHHQPIPQALFALANGVDPAPGRRHALAQIEVEAFYKYRVDGPVTRAKTCSMAS